MTPVCIGIGAVLQAMLGATLVRRFVGFPNPLNRGRDVLAFFGLAGPLSCLFGATWGVTTLWLTGLMQGAVCPFSWWTWLVGDTIGVLVVTPLPLIFVAQPRAVWRHRRLTVAVPLLLLFALVVECFMLVSAWEQQRIRLRFEQRVRAHAYDARKSFAGYVELLNNLRAFFTASAGVTREQFHTYVTPLLSRHPEIQAISWDAVIPDAQRVAFEQEMQRAGYPDFQITQRDRSGNLVRAEKRPLYVPIMYRESHDPRTTVLGLDVASLPGRREAFDRACRLDTAIATEGVTLPRGSAGQTGVILYIPTYRFDQRPDETDNGCAEVTGYCAIVLQMDQVMASSIKLLDQEETEIRLVDESAPPSGKRLLWSLESPATKGQTTSVSATPESDADAMRWSDGFEMAGRNWRLGFSRSSAYLVANRSWEAWIVLAGGLLYTWLLVAFLLVVTGQTALVAQLVTQRTAELTLARENLLEQNSRLEAMTIELSETNIGLALVSRVDALTGQLNRRAWNEMAQLEQTRSERHNHVYSLFMIDIDHFKAFNDSKGHSAGDECLSQVARRISSLCRGTDVIGRYGGEEFVVLLPETNLDGALQLAQRITKGVWDENISHPISPLGRVTVSIGVATWNGEPLESIIKAADDALYLAKNKGRNCVRSQCEAAASAS